MADRVERPLKGLGIQARLGPAQLRVIAKSRVLILIVLPMGVVLGGFVTLLLAGLDRIESLLENLGHRHHFALLLPLLGMTLNAALLRAFHLEGASLSHDLERSRKDPFGAFPLGKSLLKAAGCALTIGFGGSAGVEGPSKWLGSAIGIQFHKLSALLGRRFRLLRRFMGRPQVVMTAGAAAALASVFRAPISGALLAAEREGRLNPDTQIPALAAGAASYLTFSLVWGYQPLFLLRRHYQMEASLLGWALLLGCFCGAGTLLYRWVQRCLAQKLKKLPLIWRGLFGGICLVLLGVCSDFLGIPGMAFHGGGLDLVRFQMDYASLSSTALLFFSLKLLATALTFSAGGIGGLWLPSLAMGAGLGSLVQVIGGTDPGLLVLVGACAFAGSMHRTLLVPTVFIAETTGQGALVVPCLLATVLAYLLSSDG